MAQLAEFLLDYEMYQFGPATLRNDERSTPYMVKLPTTPRLQLFDILANVTVAKAIIDVSRQLHLVGIAKSGVPMASAIAQQLKAMGSPLEYSVYDPRQPAAWFDNTVDRTWPVLLIDNAVTTGDTLETTAQTLRSQGTKIEGVLSIFNREEIGRDGYSTIERIQRRLGINLQYIFAVRELLQVISQHEREVISQYLADYGTPDIKVYVK